jgi:adenosylcobinamide kinase / adenosylcobinamide-phosphate guanylyltransferase
MNELILGGQRSGKSRRAELLARDWLAAEPGRRAVMIATGQALDDEMRERIAQHQRDRAQRVPGMETVEEPLALARAIAAHGNGKTMLVVDCLTLWLTNQLMPASGEPVALDAAALTAAISAAEGPVILVSNEIGLGVIPMGGATRAFVDELGRLNQAVANACGRVTLMVAGQALHVKGAA